MITINLLLLIVAIVRLIIDIAKILIDAKMRPLSLTQAEKHQSL